MHEIERFRAGARRRIVTTGKRTLRRVFEVGQRAGVDILPRHFYSAIPDIRRLRAEAGWREPHTMAGVSGLDIGAQLAWLRETCPPEIARVAAERGLYEEAAEENGAAGYGPVELQVLYCLVRSRAPRRVVQVGAGASTWAILAAASDAGRDIDVVAVDPYPTPLLERLSAEGRIDLRRVPVQALPVDELTALEAGDVLFVDSTHTVAPGSDVNHLVLEVLPRLRRGVLVHFHDVTWPYDHAPGLLDGDLFFWNESVLVHAYLADNARVVARYSGSYLHDRARAEAQAILPGYTDPLDTDRGIGRGEGQFPSALWAEVVADPPAGT